MRFFAFALALVLAPEALAQYAVTSGQPTSAEQVAAVGGLSVLPTDDPMGFHLNPALVSGLRSGVTVGGALAPQNLFSGDQRAEAVVGIGGAATVAGVPLRLGAGLSTARYARDLVIQYAPEQTPFRYDERETNVALGLGAETTGPVRLALGVAARTIGTSASIEDGISERRRGVSADLGLLATADVAALAGLSPEASGVVPVAELSLGYAVRNVGPESSILTPLGDEIFEREAPLPREAVLGWSGTVGADLGTRAGRLPLVRISADVESSGSMLDYTDFGSSQIGYTGPLGSLRLVDALIGRGRVDEIVCGERCIAQRFTYGHRAVSVEALGAVRVTMGRRNLGDDFVTDRAWGVGMEPLALANAIGALGGASRPLVQSPVDLRLGYARALMDPGQILPVYEGTDAFTVTLGWVP